MDSGLVEEDDSR